MMQHLIVTGFGALVLAMLLGCQLAVCFWLLITSPKKEKIVEVVEEPVLDKEEQAWANYHKLSAKK